MKGSGIALIVLGALLMVGALIFQPTVSTGGLYGAPSEVYNLGALQYQQLIFEGGAALLIAGTVLFAGGSLLNRGAAAVIGKESAAIQSKCAWCEAMVAAPSTPCSDYPDEKLREKAGSITNSRCRAVMAERGLL